MADLIHRTERDATGKLLRAHSVHTPDADPQVWLIDPDLSAVSGVPERHWKVVGDSVVEMSQAEKDVVEAARLANAKTTRKTYLKQRTWELMEQQYPNQEGDLLMALFVNAKTNGMPNRAAHIQQVWAWKEGLANHAETKLTAVNDATTVAEVNAIELNESAIIGGDPGVTVKNALAIID